MRVLLASIALLASSAHAQVVTSAAPDSVSVTLYRDPDRAGDDAIDRTSPQGFALITEARTVHLPAGYATIRFEGVAGGIFPESAIVRGLPAEAREKNLDADLLSPRSLYDRALGRRVLIRRTDKATGRLSESQAIIRSSAAGGMVLQTADGIETLHCSGASEAVVYPELPPGLSAKPTLSIDVDSPTATDAVLSLSYLAGGFDWQADYVATMRPDGQGADLFAWITLASADVTSFADATTQIVAGTVNHEERLAPSYRGQTLDLRCWPQADTVIADDLQALPLASAPPPPPPPPPPAVAQDVVVTAMRKAVQEELGDLKLYRIQDRVTVAARSQKQVAMLARDAVPMATVYVSEVWNGEASDPQLTLRARNRADAGLGLPLPAGQVAVFEDGGRRPVLAGEGAIADKAVGEDVEFSLGERPGVSAVTDTGEPHGKRHPFRLTVTNASPWPIRYEARFHLDGSRLSVAGVKLGTRDGLPLWAPEIAANGTATLDYTLKR